MSKEKKICSVEGCDCVVVGRGLCAKHYQRFMKYGNTNGRHVFEHEKECIIEGCNRNRRALGYCKKHYRAFKKWGDPLFDWYEKKECSVDGCNNIAKSKGFCGKHYQRYVKYGDPLFTSCELHGMTNTTEYHIWDSMKARCYNKNDSSYPHYGGRGIEMCDQWKNSFTSFFSDMGNRPSTNHSIDRIDNDKGYYKENCRWVTIKENNRNKSTTILNENIVIEIRNKWDSGNYSGSDLAHEYGITEKHISSVVTRNSWKDV